MSLKPRYALDTNVIVSALLFEQSVPGKVFSAVLYLAKEVISPEALIDAKKAFAEARKRLKAANDQLKRAPKDGSNRPHG